MRLLVHAFQLPKAGNTWEEYEDAWAYNEEAQRLAIADGASDAFASRLWANALVHALVQNFPAPNPESILDWLEPPIQSWREQIPWEQLPWYAEEKARRGAFSTLLGMTFSLPTGILAKGAVAPGYWQAVAVGDVCLFQIRENQVITRFPVERSTDFGTTPPLLSTREDYNRRTLEELRSCEGVCRSGDLFVLATDAFAAWFLLQVEARGEPWQRLLKLTPGRFARLVERLRREEALRNDDVTLLLAQVEDEPMLATDGRHRWRKGK